MARPLFLISNDDGVHAPGIRALAAAVTPLGDWVIVAPHVERSGSGQALSLAVPLRVETLASNVFGVEGTPADCVIIAMARLLNRKPDFVLSGINRGSNIGQDVHYSGTVAAAMEGILQGIPSIAFSLKGRRSFAIEDYADAGQVVRLILSDAELLHAARDSVLNVNIPDRSLASMRGIAVSHLGRRVYDNSITAAVDPRGRPYYWIGGGGEEVEAIEETDCLKLQDGFVTLTALTPDRTDRAVNGTLRTKAGSLWAKLGQSS